jgi:tRNA(fMet)-specific endonuclease VapC
VAVRRLLVDTNAYTRLMRGDERVLELLGAADVVFLSVVVMGELYAGFKRGQREYDNRRLLSEFISRATVKVLFVTGQTAEVFGDVKDSLKKKGTPIPINDVWIAAHAIENGATLVTFDHHFNRVMGLGLLLLE